MVSITRFGAMTGGIQDYIDQALGQLDQKMKTAVRQSAIVSNS